MIASYLETPAFVLLFAAMVFNLTQRSHIDHGERKRFASLYAAVVFLVFYVGLIAVQRFFSASMADGMLIPLFLMTGLLFWILRGKIFIFRLNCGECGTRLPVHTTLYYDDNLCLACRERARKPSDTIDAAVSADLADTDPLINPPDKNLLDYVPRNVDDFDWEAWEPSETAVLCYVFKDEHVLLIHKKRGLGRGKVNAPGGRIEAGEAPVQTAVRELQEEVGITPLSPFEVARLSFVFTNGYSLKGHVFFANDFDGTIIETDEADPFWTPVDQIPYHRMWEDDRLWLPRAIDGSFIDARFIFEGENMVSHHIREESRG